MSAYINQKSLDHIIIKQQYSKHLCYCGVFNDTLKKKNKKINKRSSVSSYNHDNGIDPHITGKVTRGWNRNKTVSIFTHFQIDDLCALNTARSSRITRKNSVRRNKLTRYDRKYIPRNPVHTSTEELPVRRNLQKGESLDRHLTFFFFVNNKPYTRRKVLLCTMNTDQRVRGHPKYTAARVYVHNSTSLNKRCNRK